MKKILSAIIFLAAALTLSAQDARQRTVDTIVSDVLAAMPAQNSTDFNTQISDLAASAPASVVKVAEMMKPAATGVKNNIYEYALTGLATYASANAKNVDNVREGFTQAIKATADKTNKQFLMAQLRKIAKIDDAPLYQSLVSDPDLAAEAIGALVDIPGTDEMILGLVKEGTVSKSLLASAAAEKGLTAAEPYLQSWAATSEGTELKSVCSALASIGSASSLDILKKNSTPDYAALAVKLADGAKSKSVAKAAKELFASEVSGYKSAGALTQMKNDPAKAIKTLKTALSSSDIKFRNAALVDATQVAGTDAVSALLQKEYSKFSDELKTDAVNWFGANKIASAASIVSAAAGSNGELGKAALTAASKIGGDECLSAIVSQLGGENRLTASSALKSFKGDIQTAVGSALDKAIADNDGSKDSENTLLDLLSIVQGRKLTGLSSEVYSLIGSSDNNVATAAKAALSGVAGTSDIAKIGSLLDNASDPVSTSLYQNDLEAAIHTLSADDQYSKVSELISKAKNAGKFYSVLSSTGTDKAVEDLFAAYNATKSGDAVNALTEIDNFSAAKPLLEIAKSDADYKNIAANAYAELVSKYETDADKKVADYASALATTDDKSTVKTILSSLAKTPTMKSLMLAGKYMDSSDKDIKWNAADAVKKIAASAKDELDYNTMTTSLKKAAEIFTGTGDADDEYAVKEINDILSKAEPSPVSQLTDEEVAQGFEMLFDGTNLDKFQGDKEGYIPMNGTIYVSANYGSTGNLYTLKQYRNFVFRFEFCFLRSGVNNGVGIRTPMGVDAAYEGMCECQILDHDADIYSSWLREYQVHGSVYGVIPAKRIVHKPLGEWSTEEIRVEGDHIKVTVNGEVIVDGDIRKACKGHNVAPDGSDVNPYTVDHRNHPGMFNKQGYISFCGHGEGLKLRNVRVLDLGNKK